METRYSKPTYVGDFYVEFHGTLVLNEVTNILNLCSVVYVVEPQPDDNYRVFVKSEAASALMAANEEAEAIVAEMVIKEMKKLKRKDRNENHRSTETSQQGHEG